MVTGLDFFPSKKEIQAQIIRISKRSSIGRSKNYFKLLEYLIEKECSSQTIEASCNAPKETEIAIDVFSKDTDFNPGDDATVRVHISNLRKKLEAYYQDEGDEEAFFITIPTGGYRVKFILNAHYSNQQEAAPVKGGADDNQPKFLSKPLNLTFLSVVVFVIISLIIHFSLFMTPAPQKVTTFHTLQANDAIKSHIIWKSLPERENKVIIAIGEKDIFRSAEINNLTGNTVSKNENSVQYISRGKAVALKNILAIFNDDHRVQFKLASELTAKNIRTSSIIYIGNFQSMGILSKYFSGSNFLLNETQSALMVKDSTDIFTMPTELSEKYIDYGVFAKVKGPRKYNIYIIAGFTDSALLQLSWYFSRTETLFSSSFYKVMKKFNVNPENSFELLFRVKSLNGIDLNHTIISGNNLSQKVK